MPALRDLVDPASVRLDVAAPDWRAAMRSSGDLLVAAGVTTPAYTDAMIRTVEEHGPYIVISPGFALAHARPDDSVLRTGLSVVRLAEPVAFGHEGNDPVRLVVALAAADAASHQAALAELAGVLADPPRRAALDTAPTVDALLAVLTTPEAADTPAPVGTAPATPTDAPAGTAAADEATVPSTGLVLTVCGNGLGTSLFLKNTLEKVLDRWGWTPFLSVEATDTISAKGRAKEADVVLTSGAIAETLGDLGVPVVVIENFTATDELDAALRRVYAV